MGGDVNPRSMIFRDPVSDLADDDPCWCKSGIRHAECHGDMRPASQPGEPITDLDDDEGVYVAPGLKLDRALVDGRLEQQPIYGPAPEPVQRPVRVPQAVIDMLDAPELTTVEFAALGRRWFEVLEALGLADLETLARRVRDLSAGDRDELVYAALSIARATLDRIAELSQAADGPTMIWSDARRPTQVIGATLLWADHYLILDGVSSALISDAHSSVLESAIRELLEIRPLIETGFAVPVLRAAAETLALPETYAAAQADLEAGDLVPWVRERLVVEGPTARNALLFSLRDDVEECVRLEFMTSSLDAVSPTEYDPTAYDYPQWIDEKSQQTAVQVIRQVNEDLAIANRFAASWVTLSPFKQQLLQRRGANPSEPADLNALVRSDVVQLTQAGARSLAAIAAQDETVEALRLRVRATFSAMRSLGPEDRRAAAYDLGQTLQVEAERLRREMNTNRRWKMTIPGALSVGSGGAAVATVVIGAAGTAVAPIVWPLAALSAVLGTAAATAPFRADSAESRGNAAYALLLGEQLVGRRRWRGQR